jgi:hypothetical protein
MCNVLRRIRFQREVLFSFFFIFLSRKTFTSYGKFEQCALIILGKRQLHQPQGRMEDSALFYFASKISTFLKALKDDARNSGTSFEVHLLYSYLL